MIYSDEPEAVQQMLYVHRLIQKRIGTSATKRSLEPLWYRGLSDIQMAAADSLQAALADDILEGSTYRVHYVLHRLGVSPRPPKSGLFRLYPMSRGNDVAFLWFLMESYYTSENHDKLYGSNEQLIMSTIFWLDLYPTLRELDRVLPLPHASEETRKKEALAEARRLKHEEREKQKKAKERLITQGKPEQQDTHSILPYFQKPPRRKFHRQNLLATAAKLPANLPIVPPESANSTLWSRWYGHFDFSGGQGIATSVLKSEIDNIISTLEATKLKKDHVKSMCINHQRIREMEVSLQSNLEKIKQQKRQLLLTMDHRSKERNRRRTLEHLDRMTQHYQQKFHAMAVKTRMSSNRKKLCAELHTSNFVYLGSVDCTSEDNDVKLLKGCDPWPIAWQDCRPEETNTRCKCKQRQLLTPRPTTMKRFLQLRSIDIDRVKTKESTSSGHCSCRRECPKYFDFSGNGYKFNYRKLFEPCKFTKLEEDQNRIRVEFLKALDEDVEHLRSVLDGDKSDAIDTLVDRSAKQIFRQGAQVFKQEYEKMEAEELKKEPDHRLDFGQKYYDADNIELMKHMLRSGLDRVAEDRRYILPTLPNVHSVPLLIKWICSRYGKLYSLADHKRDFSKANILMNNLIFILRKEIVRRKCSRPLVLPRKLMSIREQNKMSRLLSYYWGQFIKYFMLSIMELGRIFHSTMQADQGSKSTATYYAYMPAHIHDLEYSKTVPFFDRRKRTKLT